MYNLNTNTPSNPTSKGQTKEKSFAMQILILIFAVLMFTANSIMAQEAVFLNWVNHFALQDSIMPNPVVTDAAGNVYVAGYNLNSTTGPDIVVVKYNSHGDTVWAKYYTGSGNHRDQATAIAVDSSTYDVYVAGFTYASSGNNYDAILIKYNSSGTQQWVQTYNVPGSYYDAAAAIYLKGSYVYITGASFGGFTTMVDYFTIKYNATTGVQQWVSRYDYNNNNDIAYSITVGVNDSVYVTGGSQSSSTNWDYATITYNSAGTQVNATRITGAGYGLDHATAITTDKKGFVYFTGGSMNASGNYDYKTIKMNAAGTIVYNKTYDYNNLDDIANAIAVDTMGNCYITGQSKSAMNDNDYCTIKYDSAGNQLWVKRYDGDAHGSDIAHNLFWDIYNNNIYITGESSNGADQDYLTISYNHNGHELWHQVYDGGADDIASDITADSTDVFVTGSSVDPSTSTISYITLDYGITDFIVPPDTEAVAGTTAFFPNYGQIVHTDTTTASEVLYYTLHNYPVNYFLQDTISFVFASKLDSATHTDTLQRIDMSFAPPSRGSINSTPLGADKLESGYLNYYLPQCGSGITDVYGYERVVYPGVWSNIDVEFAGNADGLKYYIIAKPGSDSADIELIFDGADSVNVLSSGELKIVSHWGSVTFKAPEVYQIDAYGNRDTTTLSASYFSFGAVHVRLHFDGIYDLSKAIGVQIGIQHHIPSPALCSFQNTGWSSYIGGYNNGLDFATGINTDEDGNSYMYLIDALATYPPAISQPIVQCSPGTNCFIIKFAPSQSNYSNPNYNVMWCTFFGSISDTRPNSLSIRNNGIHDHQAYITGTHAGSNFFQHQSNAAGDFNYGATCNQNGFILRLDDGGHNIWSSCIGGNDLSQGFGIAVNNNDPSHQCVYVVGKTVSTDFHTCSTCTLPTSNSYWQPTKANDWDGWITKFDFNDNLIWSTYFGGNSFDEFKSIAILGNNNIVIDGNTSSTHPFSYTWSSAPAPAQNSGSIQLANPGLGAYSNTTFVSGDINNELLVSFNSDDELLWSTYFGGSGEDDIRTNSIVKTSTDNFYVVGFTHSTDFPVLSLTGAYNQSTIGGDIDLFLAEFNNSFNQKWTTYFGGSGPEEGWAGSGTGAITVDYYNNVYIAGSTFSSSGCTSTTCYCEVPPTGEFPICNHNNCYYSCGYGGDATCPDAFIAGFNSSNHLIWSTYLGSYNNVIDGLAFDNSNNRLYFADGYGISGFPNPFPQNQYPSSNLYWQFSTIANINDADIGFFDMNCMPTGILPINPIISENILVYPNPSNSTLQIQAETVLSGNIQIEIDNLFGQKITEQEYKNNGNYILTIDISSLSEGCYVVKIRSQNKVETRKFMKI